MYIYLYHVWSLSIISNFLFLNKIILLKLTNLLKSYKYCKNIFDSSDNGLHIYLIKTKHFIFLPLRTFSYIALI